MLAKTLALIALSSLAAAASAQTPIGPFAGTDSDGFETQTPFSLDPCIIERVFSSQADLCTPSGAGATIDTSLTSACTVLPHTGSFLYGSVRGYSEIQFDTPVSRFGAYFAVNSGLPNGSAMFFDELDNFLSIMPITAPADCSWTWNGWCANPGQEFGRILFRSNHGTSGGGFMQIDDMEADFGLGGCGGPGGKQCFGDGIDNACPCGNDNDGSGSRGGSAGCANSNLSSGCHLDGTGSNSIGAADAVLCFTGAIPHQPGLLYAGTLRNPIPFGDGIRCCGGNLVRLQVIIADASGSGCSTVVLGSATGAIPGSTWCYQFWYRDPIGPCGSGFNLSNAYKITWTP